jgi:ArsR family transcriptional regulator
MRIYWARRGFDEGGSQVAERFDARLKEELEELTAGVCRALSDPKRLMILYALADRPRAVGELAELLEVSPSNVSQHLGLLRDRGLVDAERDANRVIYTLRDRRVVEAIDVMRTVMTDELDRRRAIRAG